MKKYRISFSFSVSEGDYGPTLVSSTVTETGPDDLDPDEYIRARFREEMRRKFADVSFEEDEKNA